MKKFYMILFLASAGAVTYAQNDVSVSLNNYTSGQATSDDPLDMVFTITNEGTSVISSGDTLYFAFVVGFQNYSMNLTPGSVSYVMLLADFDPGTSFDLSMLLTPPSTMNMQWIYEERGSLTGDICAFAGIGVASLTLDPAADADYTDNTMCVSYTVTEVAGFEDQDVSSFSVYPNPASEVLNLKFKSIEGDVTISIVDMTGRILCSEIIQYADEKSYVLNTGEFENGNYIVTVSKDGAVLRSEKLIIAH